MPNRKREKMMSALIKNERRETMPVANRVDAIAILDCEAKFRRQKWNDSALSHVIPIRTEANIAVISKVHFTRFMKTLPSAYQLYFASIFWLFIEQDVLPYSLEYDGKMQVWGQPDLVSSEAWWIPCLYLLPWQKFLLVVPHGHHQGRRNRS